LSTKTFKQNQILVLSFLSYVLSVSCLMSYVLSLRFIYHLISYIFNSNYLLALFYPLSLMIFSVYCYCFIRHSGFWFRHSHTYPLSLSSIVHHPSFIYCLLFTAYCLLSIHPFYSSPLSFFLASLDHLLLGFSSSISVNIFTAFSLFSFS